MREIKFRAWDTENKRMLIPAMPLIGGGLSWGEKGGYDAGGRDYILEQFTGEEDFDDVDIFEGDVIEVTYDDGEKHRTIVKYQDGGFIVEGPFGDADLLTIGWAMDHWENSGDLAHVIGNIHENPELLK